MNTNKISTIFLIGFLIFSLKLNSFNVILKSVDNQIGEELNLLQLSLMDYITSTKYTTLESYLNYNDLDCLNGFFCRKSQLELTSSVFNTIKTNIIGFEQIKKLNCGFNEINLSFNVYSFLHIFTSDLSINCCIFIFYADGIFYLATVDLAYDSSFPLNQVLFIRNLKTDSWHDACLCPKFIKNSKSSLCIYID